MEKYYRPNPYFSQGDPIHPDAYKYNSFNRLCKYYNVDYKTFKEWINPVETFINDCDNESRALKPEEVQMIFNCIGPRVATDEKRMFGITSDKYNTITALAKIYGVSRKTLRERIEPVREEISKNVYINRHDWREKIRPGELRFIVEFLGTPPRPVEQEPEIKVDERTTHNETPDKKKENAIEKQKPTAKKRNDEEEVPSSNKNEDKKQKKTKLFSGIKNLFRNKKG
ncbi:MAG: hypothetical protein K8R53_09185 [Bacteroidales bacterium]|nr:hypothetical protein [Bacteroidales bacterium]